MLAAPALAATPPSRDRVSAGLSFSFITDAWGGSAAGERTRWTSWRWLHPSVGVGLVHLRHLAFQDAAGITVGTHDTALLGRAGVVLGPPEWRVQLAAMLIAGPQLYARRESLDLPALGVHSSYSDSEWRLRAGPMAELRVRIAGRWWAALSVQRTFAAGQSPPTWEGTLGASFTP